MGSLVWLDKGVIIGNEVKKLSANQIIWSLVDQWLPTTAVDHCKITVAFTMNETGSSWRVLSKYVTSEYCVKKNEGGQGCKSKETK